MTGQQVMARLRERDGDGELLSLVKRLAAAHHVTVDEPAANQRTTGRSDAADGPGASWGEGDGT